MAGNSRKVRAGRAFVEFFLDHAPLVRGLKLAEKKLKAFGQSIKSIGMKAFTAGFAGLAGLTLPIAQFVSFDDAIRMVGAVSQSTEAELAMLTARARSLGLATSFTAVEVAQMMTELARAGFRPDEINVMTEAVMNLARASGTDAALSSGIMAATIRQFSLSASDAARVSDVLTYAANATFNSVESLGESLSYAGPVASSFGMSLEDTVAILGTLGNVGIQGSMAGTALRRMMTITAAEAEKMQEIFGVSFLDSAHNIRPLIEVMGELGAATANLPSGDRAEKFNEAFGLLGITGATVMSNTAVATEELATKLLDVGGVAAETAAKMDAGIGGVWRRMTSSFEGASIELGTRLGPMLERLGEWITGIAVRAAEWMAANEGLVISLVQGIAVLTAVGAAAVVASFAISTLGTVIGVVASVIGFLLTPFGIVTALLAVLAYRVLDGTGALKGLAATLTDTFGPAWDAIVGKVMSGDLAGAMTLAWGIVGATWDIGIAALSLKWTEFSNWLGTAVTGTGQFLSEIWTQFWSSFSWAVADLWANIKDTFQAMTDWANRMVGRKPPARKTNADKVAEAKRAEEEKRQNEHNQRNQLVADVNAEAEDKKRDALNAAMAALDKLIADVKAPPPEPDAPPAPKPAATPQSRMKQAMEIGTATALNANAGSVDAVLASSTEGQKAIATAMGFKTADEQVKAIEDLQKSIEDEFDATRRENADAPRVGGTRGR